MDCVLGYTLPEMGAKTVVIHSPKGEWIVEVHSSMNACCIASAPLHQDVTNRSAAQILRRTHLPILKLRYFTRWCWLLITASFVQSCLAEVNEAVRLHISRAQFVAEAEIVLVDGRKAWKVIRLHRSTSDWTKHYSEYLAIPEMETGTRYLWVGIQGAGGQVENWCHPITSDRTVFLAAVPGAGSDPIRITEIVALCLAKP